MLHHVLQPYRKNTATRMRELGAFPITGWVEPDAAHQLPAAYLDAAIAVCFVAASAVAWLADFVASRPFDAPR